MAVIQNNEVSVSEGLTLYGHAFETFRVCLNNRVLREASIKGLALQQFVLVAKLSIERGFLVLRVYN